MHAIYQIEMPNGFGNTRILFLLHPLPENKGLWTPKDGKPTFECESYAREMSASCTT